MELTITSDALTETTADWLLVPMFDGQNAHDLSGLPQGSRAVIQRAIDSGDASGAAGELTVVYATELPDLGRLMIVGLGPADSLTTRVVRESFGSASKRIAAKPAQSVAVLPPTVSTLSPADFARSLCDGLTVGCTGQDLYRSARKLSPLREIQLLGDTFSANARAAREGKAIGDAVNITRDLVNRSPADVDPQEFAQRAEQIALELGMNCRIFDETELAAERMNAMLAVARGSARPPRMVVMEYNGGEPNGEEIAFVGKGVTFDSGGLSLKPTDNMKTMKCDMAGAATVLGAMEAIARLKLPCNIVGFMGLVENMPGADAFKLGDVLTARNGTTIEVLNTDAEGRLVLADVLCYAVDRGADQIVDLATLTGACVVALGEDVTGAFTNNQQWCDKVLHAAAEVQEDIWQMPMFDLFDKLIDGEVSDIKNVGPRWGGAVTAAKFLQRFVGATPWVHLDIAGPAFSTTAKDSVDAGASGCMVRTLVKAAANFARRQA